MKVSFHPKSKNGDSVRGIGVHTTELLKELTKLPDNKFKVVEDDASADVVHFTVFRPFLKNEVPFFKPKGVKFVLTIHDLIPLIYPKNYPPGVKGKIRFLYNKFLVRKNIDAIITISETSKKDICRFLEVNPEKVFVTYLGYKKEYKKISDKKIFTDVKSKYSLPDKFVFYFGDINYNKNVPTLIKACEKLGIPLVIAGKQVLEVEQMDLNHPEHRHLKDIDFSKTIRLGFISDEDANTVLNLATCLVQPSFYEGFGLSVIHAFAAGCPVIVSKTNCFVEISDDAALYFDANDSSDLVEKIKSLIKDKDLRSSLVKKGFERVRGFSWTKCAKETLAVYEKVVNKV